MASLIAIFGANIAPFIRELNRAKDEAQKGGSGIASKFGSEITNKLAGIASVAGITAIVKQTIEWGSHVSDLSDRLGISTDAVQQWDFALRQNGSSIEAVAPFFDKLAKARQDAFRGNDEAIAGFRTFGITIDQLRSIRLEEIGERIAKTFQQAPDPQPLLADLRNIGGRSAGELVTAFRAGLTDLFAVAPVVKPEVISQLDELDDTFARVKAEFTAAVAPALVTVLNTIMELITVARLILAAPIGALMGLIDAARTIKITDFLTGEAARKLITGAGEGMFEAVEAVSRQAIDEDTKAKEAAAAKRAAMAVPRGGTIEVDETKKAQSERQRAIQEAAHNHQAHMDRVLKLEDDLRKKKDANALAEMTNAEKIFELERRKAELAAKTFVPESEADLERQIAIEDIDKQIGDIERRKKPLSATQQVNELQRIGGFLGNFQAAPELAMLDLSRKQEQHLAAIRKAVERKAPAPITAAGVNY